MLLVELEISGTSYYLSQEGLALNRYWDALVQTFDPPQYSMEKPYGGYIRPSYGGITFFHNLFSSTTFANVWVPPTACQIAIHYTNSDQDSSVTLFTGTAHFDGLNREEVRYNLYGEKVGGGATVGKGIAYQNISLKDVFTSCAVTAGLSLDTSLAKSSNTEVYHTVTSDQEITSFLSNLSASFTHTYYTKEGTLYLVDMNQDNGTTTIDFYFYPSNYETNAPLSFVTSGVSKSSSGATYPYGTELSTTLFVESETSTQACLDSIWDVYHKPIMHLRVPFTEPLVTTPRTRVQWLDTAHGADVSAYQRVQSLRYDIDNEEIILSGEGEWEAG